MACASGVGVNPNQQQKEEENRVDEDEEEFIELDLEVLNRIPTARYYQSYQVTSDALLANCLLPVRYVCNAIPIDSRLHGRPSTKPQQYYYKRLPMVTTTGTKSRRPR
ncbi:hypothetical protein BHE74_00052862 [Ensete ventricosum]|nr:hypothetical protein BHE74_00052862 [Ensete ventricosum]RZS12489.1 hypothetical protein BHM03_00043958 [Ensete ventricosum]